MIVEYKTNNNMQIKRLAKADDMALFILDLVNNGWRDFKHTEYDYTKAWDKIRELLDVYHIDPYDLIE